MSSEMGKVTIYGLTEEGLGAAEGRKGMGRGRVPYSMQRKSHV